MGERGLLHKDAGGTPPVLDGVFETFADAFEAAAAQFGGREAYVEGMRRLNFSDWHAKSDALAGALQSRGVKPGDVVLIGLESSIEFAIAYGAAILMGAVASGINRRLGPREIAAIITRSAPKALLIEDEAAAPDGVPIMIRRRELAALCAGERLGARRMRGRKSDPAVIIWTSGTTGTPKGAWFDHANLEAAVRLAGPMAAAFDRRLVSTPFAHSGYMIKGWEQLGFGLCNVIPPVPWRAQDMLKLIVDERISMAGGVPTQWAKLLSLPETAAADFSAVRIAVVATAPAPPELVAAVTKTLGCPLIVRYALTESPSATGTIPNDEPETLFHTVGRPQPGVELRLVDGKGAPVACGEVGIVQLRSPAVMRGYWHDAERTRQALSPEGWLLTGDFGRLDEAGNLVLAGRTSEMYIRGGYNIYPLEVEHVLSERDDISQVAVVGVPAPVIGEIGVAFVVPADPDRPPTLEAMRQWCRARLADYKAPDRVEIVEALPLTAMMKIDKTSLRARALAAQAETTQGQPLRMEDAR